MKNLFLFIFTNLFLLLAGTMSQAVPREKPKVGILIPLSGVFAELGSDSREGIETALSLVKIKNFQLVYGDSKADAITGVNEFRKLVKQDGVLGMFTIRSPVGMAINPISQTLGIPLLGAVGQRSFVPMNEFAWRTWTNALDEGIFLGEALIKSKFKKIAIVTTQDDWTNDVSLSLKARLRESNLELSTFEVLPTEVDFRSIVSKIKTAGVEATVANLTISQLGTFFKQAATQQLQGAKYSNSWVAKKQVIQDAGKQNMEGVRFIEMDTNLPVFRKTLSDRFSSVPSGATLSAYVSTLFFAEAFTKFPTITTPKELYEAFSAIHSVQTPDGVIMIKERNFQFRLVERVVRGGIAVAVD